MSYTSRITAWFTSGARPNDAKQMVSILEEIDSALVLSNGPVSTATGTASPVALTTTGTSLVVTSGAQAFTLADGTVGAVKNIILKTDGGDATITPTNFKNGTTITLNDAGDSVVLLFVDSEWHLLSNNGATIV